MASTREARSAIAWRLLSVPPRPHSAALAIKTRAQSYAVSSPAALSIASGMNRFALVSMNAHAALRAPETAATFYYSLAVDALVTTESANAAQADAGVSRGR